MRAHWLQLEVVHVIIKLSPHARDAAPERLGPVNLNVIVKFWPLMIKISQCLTSLRVTWLGLAQHCTIRILYEDCVSQLLVPIRCLWRSRGQSEILSYHITAEETSTLADWISTIAPCPGCHWDRIHECSDPSAHILESKFFFYCVGMKLRLLSEFLTQLRVKLIFIFSSVGKIQIVICQFKSEGCRVMRVWIGFIMILVL